MRRERSMRYWKGGSPPRSRARIDAGAGAAAPPSPSLLRRLALLFRDPGALGLKRARDRADLLHIGIERVGEVVRDEAVIDILPPLLARDQSGILEHGEVLGDGGPGHFEARGDLARVQLGMGEVSENLPPGRGGERFEHLLHGKYLRNQ